jgi:hypothetical protein
VTKPKSFRSVTPDTDRRGVSRFTSFDDAVRFASQLCGTPGCRYCDKETGDE